MNRQHNDNSAPNVAMAFGEMIRPILATLDEDQLDRLLAKGFDDLDGYMKLLKAEMKIRHGRMRQESLQLMSELNQEKEKKQAQEKRIKELEAEVERLRTSLRA